MDLTIGQVAARAGVNTSHIRYYEAVGVLPPPTRVSGRRRYGEDVPHRLSIIDALIERAQAVKRWLEVARGCDCSTVDVCGLFVDPTLAPPPGDVGLTIRRIG